MKKITRPLLLITILLQSHFAFAWGTEGHAIVGRLALQMVTPETRQNVMKILEGMSIDTATNWMDIVRSNSDYDFMKSWHYVDYPKGSQYQVTNGDNIVNRLLWTYKELENKKVLCDEQIKMDLYVILHLMGDLHMPLHTGYDDDLGGNKVMVQYDTLKTHNLHKFWDEDIIRLTGITDASVLKQNTIPSNSKSQVDFMAWMNESRGLLKDVYNYEGFILDKKYMEMSKVIVEKQLYLAALRLALILNKLFPIPTPTINFKEAGKDYKNLVEAKEAVNYVSKSITVCSRIYGIRSTEKITQINIEAPFPNSPFTIIIFAYSYNKFPQPIAEYYKDKNICVKGKVELYKDKPQIIIDNPEDIIIK